MTQAKKTETEQSEAVKQAEAANAKVQPKAERPRRRAAPEVVRRRKPGYKLVNGGWKKDPETAREKGE